MPRLGRRFVRVTVRLPDGRGASKRRAVWARVSDGANTPWDAMKKRAGLRTYTVLSRDGDETGEIIIASKNNVVSERPAKMNMKYAELEVAKEAK